MPFDGVFLSCVCKEMDAAVDAHIDKIYQPSREELVLVLRKKGFVKKLYISARSGMARMHFTENLPENPDVPPMFCMLARKHFSSARLNSIKMRGFERVAELCFTGKDELGDRVELKIICEFIGAGNIILVNGDNRIFDAVHRSDLEKSYRIIAPGAVYEYPAATGKMDILETDGTSLGETVISMGGTLSKAVLSSVEGISPLIAREIAFLSCGDDIPVADIKERSALDESIAHVKQSIMSGGSPYIYYDNTGHLFDYCFMDIKQYGDAARGEICQSYCELLDKFYAEKERKALQKRAGGDLDKLLKNLIAKVEKRKNLRINELKETRDRENLRICGELLKANIHALKSGVKTVNVANFYDPDMKTVEIPIDPALSISANAAKYFKEYKKSYSAEQSLNVLIKKDTEEADYLNSVQESLARADSISDISEIREELELYGYLKNQNRRKKVKKTPQRFSEYKSTEGYRIIVGKNNLQNDYITTVLAKKNDMWFHTKNIHGSHVIVQCGGEELSEQTVLLAAKLAAKNSKAAASSNVPVDYTPVKYVKKPSGARAGMVIYSTNKTIYVTPGEEL